MPTAAPSRRRLIADPAPAPMPPGAPAVPHATGGRWVGGETGLRSASAYLATDLSLRLLTAPPAGGAPFAVQIADDARGTGFALLWDGEAWRLQYRRAGEVLEDHPLQGVREPPPGGRLRVELALEPRSAAAWVWPAGEPQPGAPQAVFAPPPDAGTDAARPRHVVLPAPRLHPVADVSLEGLTRFS